MTSRPECCGWASWGELAGFGDGERAARGRRARRQTVAWRDHHGARRLRWSRLWSRLAPRSWLGREPDTVGEEEPMTPVHRTLAGAMLALDLAEEMRIVREELATASARIARTLVKEGPLRLTLVGLKPGGALHEHVADGPITVHVLDGEILFDVGGATHPLRAGALLALDAGVRHAARSTSGGIFLLTIAAHAKGAAGPSPDRTSH
jgi:quercetin dioxygenase-like cupin family protein